MVILHVAGVDVQPTGGMGRIVFEWKKAFENNGHQFIHLGYKELNKQTHPLLFGWEVRKLIKRKGLLPDVILAHEPAAGFLKFNDVPLILYSHGIEERDWQGRKTHQYIKSSIKSRLLPSFMRFLSNNVGFKKASAILLSNTEDKDYLIKKGIAAQKITIFKNGYYPFQITQSERGKVSFLFNATWIERKGTALLYKAFNEILAKHEDVELMLVGTKSGDEVIHAGFVEEVRKRVVNIPAFDAHQEQDFYRNSDVFVMPSYFEGQSLALTQAMAMGLCPIVSDNCGQIDFVKHMHNGLVFETGNHTSLLLNIEWLLNNRNYIVDLGAEAHKRVKDLLWPLVSEEIVKICERTLEEERR